MADDLTADEIRALLQLEPNATCGFVRQTYLSALSIAPNGLPAPFADGRPLGSALYFMVTPTAPVQLHRIRNDQLYHYYLGDPIELFLLHADGNAERIVVGPDLRAGQRVQQFIPGNTFHTARVIGQRRWFLGASTEWPGVVPADVEIGNLDELAENIRRLPRSCAPSRRRCGEPRVGWVEPTAPAHSGRPDDKLRETHQRRRKPEERWVSFHSTHPTRAGAGETKMIALYSGGSSSSSLFNVIAASSRSSSRSMRRRASSVICPSCRSR